MKLTARWPTFTAEIAVQTHPTDSLLRCDECGETCAGDTDAMADFVTEHTKRHGSTPKGPE